MALQAQHPRTRERLLALYEIAQGESATQVAYRSERNPQTVMEWVHRYNAHGPEALTYRRSGGDLPLCLMKSSVHLDTDEGYGWSICGQRFWVSSSSPGLAKVSFYGLYLYNLGQVRIWPFDRANKENTVEVLKRLRVEFPDVPIKLVWDGAPYHRAQVVREAAS